MRVTVGLWFAGIVLAGLGCCGTEGEVRQALEDDGLSDIELTPTGEPGGYEFRGTRDGEECTGFYTLKKRGIVTSESHTMSCLPPAGPVTDSLPEGTGEKVEAQARYCDAGDMGECRELGYRFEHGNGVPEDKPRGTELYVMACNGGDGMACHNAGVAYNNGFGVVLDAAQASAYFERACEIGYAKSCFDAALNLAKDTPRRDFVKAREIASRGCDLGDPSSCNTMGVFLDNAQGGPRDTEKAAELFRKACEGDVAIGCENLEKMARR